MEIKYTTPGITIEKEYKFDEKERIYKSVVYSWGDKIAHYDSGFTSPLPHYYNSNIEDLHEIIHHLELQIEEAQRLHTRDEKVLRGQDDIIMGLIFDLTKETKILKAEIAILKEKVDKE